MIKKDADKIDIKNNYEFFERHYSIEYLTFGASFFLSRSMTSFTAGESVYYRITEGIAFSIIACINDIFIGKIQTYAPSYILPALSFINKKYLYNYATTTKLLILSGTSVCVYIAVEYGEYKRFLFPLFSYLVSSEINLQNYISLVPVILSLSEELVILNNIYNNHYLTTTFITSSTLIKSISLSYPSLYKNNAFLINGIFVGIGVYLANHERFIIDQVLPSKSFSSSYSVINKIDSSKSLKFYLQKQLILNFNLYYSVSVFDNSIITKQQKLDASLINLVNSNNQLSDYYLLIDRIKNYIIFSAPILIISRTFIEIINELCISKKVYSLQSEFLDNSVIKENSFIIFYRHSNYSLQTYLDDISFIAKENIKMINEFFFIVPKITKISLISSNSITVLSSLVVIDMIANKMIQFIINTQKSYSDQKKICASIFEKVTTSDLSNSETLIHKGNLHYTKAQWSEIYRCQSYNQLIEDLCGTTSKYIDMFYIWDILYTLSKGVIASLISKNVITDSNEIFLYVKTIQSFTDVVLFKTKHESTITKIAATVDRLSNFLYFIEFNNKNNSLTNLELEKTSVDFITIKDLSFIRGDEERNISISVKNLCLSQGKIYRIEGQNGSGKSSLLSALFNIFYNIDDKDFIFKNGYLSFPNSEIMYITQKNYCPEYSRLIDIIFHPITVSNIENKVIGNNYTNVINLMKSFQVDSNSSMLIDQLNTTKNNWCNELSGGQIKKLLLIKASIICPKILFLDETTGPIDFYSEIIIRNEIKKNSCLNQSLIIEVIHNQNIWYQENNFFDECIIIDNGEASLVGDQHNHNCSP